MIKAEKDKREKSAQEAETLNTIRMIEAAAAATQQGRTVLTPEAALRLADRYTPRMPVPQDQVPKEFRPMEMRNIADFIAKRVGKSNATIFSF